VAVQPRKAPRSGAFFIWAVLLALAATAAADTARVAKVIDGDSLRLSSGREVRLIGINAPELGPDAAAAEPFAREARDRLRELTEGQTLIVQHDRERADRYGRELVYLNLPDGSDVQERLLAEGLARAIAVSPNLARLDRYLAAERTARQARRGLWGHSYYMPRPAESLGGGETGFRLVRGTVSRVGSSRRFHYLDLAPRLSLQIPREDWDRYFKGNPSDWRGRTIEARGWIVRQDYRLRLRVHHPAMMAPPP